jgi:hypothetical protein
MKNKRSLSDRGHPRTAERTKTETETETETENSTFIGGFYFFLTSTNGWPSILKKGALYFLKG